MVVDDGPTPIEFSGFESNTTNQRMELKAAIEGIRSAEHADKIKLYSDSAYLINGMNQQWYLNWEKNGWKTAKKKPVKNSDLWRELLDLTKHHDVEWNKVEGHSVVAANERCHSLVQQAVQNKLGISADEEAAGKRLSEAKKPEQNERTENNLNKKLMGGTTEYVFLNLVNQRGGFVVAFDSERPDDIAFHPDRHLFEVGQSPFFVQVKSRNSESESYGSKNFAQDDIRNVESFAKNIDLPSDSLYFVVGFSNGNDGRTIKYFAISFSSLHHFETGEWYVFSVEKCEAAMREDRGIFEL